MPARAVPVRSLEHACAAAAALAILHGPEEAPAALPYLPQVGGYAGILVSVPTILYQIAAYVVPGLTKSERQFLAPVILGSSVLFYAG